MADEKEIDWPPPGERDALHEYLGQEAGRLLAEYLEKSKGGSGTGQRRWVLRAAALDLLRTTEAPHSLVELFDVMLGGAYAKLRGMREPWLDLIVDIEARAYQEEREVTNAELATAVIDAGLMGADKKHVMRRVHKTRREDWYWPLVRCRCYYVIDNPETV